MVKFSRPIQLIVALAAGLALALTGPAAAETIELDTLLLDSVGRQPECQHRPRLHLHRQRRYRQQGRR